jgi:hypothetical protein
MKALIVAALIAAAHVAGLWLFAESGMAVSYAFFFAVAGLAMAAVVRAWHRSGTPRDRRWWLMLASLALWTVGMPCPRRRCRRASTGLWAST